MDLPLTPISKVLSIWTDFDQFGKDLEITEFDEGVQDDDVHAKYFADYLTAAFSHPSMKNFLMWGFWENAHWRASAGGAMFRADWSKRPAQLAYEDLVFHRWWTNASLKVSTAGEAKTRAFYGKHKVTVTGANGSKTLEINLVPGGEKQFTVVMK